MYAYAQFMIVGFDRPIQEACTDLCLTINDVEAR